MPLKYPSLLPSCVAGICSKQILIVKSEIANCSQMANTAPPTSNASKPNSNHNRSCHPPPSPLLLSPPPLLPPLDSSPAVYAHVDYNIYKICHKKAAHKAKVEQLREAKRCFIDADFKRVCGGGRGRGEWGQVRERASSSAQQKQFATD